jgi:hypothetical protein
MSSTSCGNATKRTHPTASAFTYRTDHVWPCARVSSWTHYRTVLCSHATMCEHLSALSVESASPRRPKSGWRQFGPKGRRTNNLEARSREVRSMPGGDLCSAARKVRAAMWSWIASSRAGSKTASNGSSTGSVESSTTNRVQKGG